MRVREPWEPLFDLLVQAALGCFAATILLVSVVVHFSAFLGIDPEAGFPVVRFIPMAIFPPFVLAVFYSWSTGRPSGQGQSQAFDRAPRSLRILTMVLVAYALVNFGFLLVLTGGGVPEQRETKFFLQSHGKVLRELNEAEYHQQRAYVARGYSGHGMLFSCGALTMLWGLARRRG